MAEKLKKRNFVVRKTTWVFSTLPIDQTHEQANAVIKANGAAIGVTEDPLHWEDGQLLAQKSATILEKHEVECQANETTQHATHHKQDTSSSTSVPWKSAKTFQVLDDMVNIFEEENRNLYSFDTKDVIHPSAVELIVTHLERGQLSFHEFLARLEKESNKKKNKVDFFWQEQTSAITSKQKVLKEDCQLLYNLLISWQRRECDLQEFFYHENQPFPAALSEGGKLYFC